MARSLTPRADAPHTSPRSVAALFQEWRLRRPGVRRQLSTLGAGIGFVAVALAARECFTVGGRTFDSPTAALKDPAVQKFLDRHVVDESAVMRSMEPFPIPPEELIALAKLFLATEAPENTSPGNGAMLTEDFRFVGPVIGPLNKAQFMDTVFSVDFFAVFPDATAQFHHFRIDPFEPNRVWYTARGTGVHTGSAEPGSDTDMMFGKPTGKRFINAPQACSLRFTKDGLVDQFTIGYVMDRYIGNTGGLGGFFGALHAVGKSFPFDEGKPWEPSLGYQIYVTIGSWFNELRAKFQGERAAAAIVMPKGSATPPQ